MLYLIEGLNKVGHISHLICHPNGALYERAIQKNILAFPLRMKGEMDFLAAFRIADVVKQEKYDIIHSHTSHALIMWASHFLKRMPIKVVTR